MPPTDTIRLDLHCHSDASFDAQLPPEALAAQLAQAGVAVAALTDHDSVAALPEFSAALAREGIAYIPGLELTTRCAGHEAHLLVYGFDPAHPELLATLDSLRHARPSGLQSVRESVRLRPALPHGTPPQSSAAADGHLDIITALGLVHRAGGLAFLAHPWFLESDPARLAALLARLKTAGLDGVEAIYAPFSPDQRQALCDLARQAGLLVSGGSDYHGAGGSGTASVGVDMPTPLWKAFRDALAARSPGLSPPEPARQRLPRSAWRPFAFHILVPTLLALGLFIGATFGYLLPTFERTLMDRKRETIRELTTSALSILAEAHRQESAGVLSRAQAQDLAKARIESLRYGREGKDYFWLQDMHPHILMHPYRRDLNNQDVSEFRDPRGVRIFVEFADVVRRKNEGYVEYVWQWNDNPERLTPKESYVHGFAPWGWIIGTGIYTDDVKQEIARLERNLVRASLGISVIVVLLLAYVIRESLRVERSRAQAVDSLHESNERYRALLEASTEGTLLVLDGRCRYGNPTLLDMLGCTLAQLQLLDLADVAPRGDENRILWQTLEELQRGAAIPPTFEATLRRRDGASVECVVSLSAITFAGRSGFILLAKNLHPSSSPGAAEAARQLAAAAAAAPVGLLRARATRRAPILEANAAARDMLRRFARASSDTPALADLFPDPADLDDILRLLDSAPAVERRLPVAAADGQTATLLLRVTLVRDEQQRGRFLHALLEDITATARREAEQAALVEKLQTSVLFLHEPLRPLIKPALTCPLETSVAAAAARMTRQEASCILVESAPGTVVGIVTDCDLRRRVLSAGAQPDVPIHRVMSAPVVSLPHDRSVYDALLTLQEHGIQHLAVTGDDGRIVGVLSAVELLQFPAHGAVAIVQEISHARDAEAVARAGRRVPALVRSLLSTDAAPHTVTRAASSVHDAVVQRLLELAHADLGPAPVPFAFLALGSHGRQEPTPLSDQDNALIYAPAEDASAAPELAAYFQQLAQRVCGGLEQAGYPRCRGEAMAVNPRWCQPVATWKRYFEDWIRKAEPQQLLEFSIFFDFRPVAGNFELAAELRRHVRQATQATPAFLPHLARNALLFKPPVGLFGRILSAVPDHPGQLDLKDAMVPLVAFARLYALRYGVDATHTLDRLQALTQLHHLQESTRADLSTAYDFLLRLRLRHHAAAFEEGRPLDNFLNLRKLAPLDETLLKECFAQIEAVQRKISFDFLGGS